MEKQSKVGKIFKRILTIFAIWLAIASVLSITYFIFFAKVKISYNGIEYSGLEAYIYVEIENKTTSQIKFDRTNFSIKGTNVAKTANELYVMDGSNGYSHQWNIYHLSQNDKIKIKLIFYRTDITTESALYYNGELVSKL